MKNLRRDNFSVTLSCSNVYEWQRKKNEVELKRNHIHKRFSNWFWKVLLYFRMLNFKILMIQLFEYYPWYWHWYNKHKFQHRNITNICINKEFIIYTKIVLEPSKLRLGCSRARTLLISNGVSSDRCVGRVLHRITVIRVCSNIINGPSSHSLKHKNVTCDIRYVNRCRVVDTLHV